MPFPPRARVSSVRGCSLAIRNSTIKSASSKDTPGQDRMIQIKNLEHLAPYLLREGTGEKPISVRQKSLERGEIFMASCSGQDVFFFLRLKFLELECFFYLCQIRQNKKLEILFIVLDLWAQLVRKSLIVKCFLVVRTDTSVLLLTIFPQALF